MYSFNDEQIADACVAAVGLLKKHGRIQGMMKDCAGGMCALGAIAEGLGLNPEYVSCSMNSPQCPISNMETDQAFEQRSSFSTVVRAINSALLDLGYTYELYDYNDSKDPKIQSHNEDVYIKLLQIAGFFRGHK